MRGVANVKNYLKLFFSYIVISTLVGCSYSDLTDLWPSGADSEEEIVIREILMSLLIQKIQKKTVLLQKLKTMKREKNL